MNKKHRETSLEKLINTEKKFIDDLLKIAGYKKQERKSALITIQKALAIRLVNLYIEVFGVDKEKVIEWGNLEDIIKFIGGYDNNKKIEFLNKAIMIYKNFYQQFFECYSDNEEIVDLLNKYRTAYYV